MTINDNVEIEKVALLMNSNRSQDVTYKAIDESAAIPSSSRKEPQTTSLRLYGIVFFAVLGGVLFGFEIR